MDDMHDLLDSLREFSLAPARLQDVLVAASGVPTSIREPVLLVSTTDASGAVDEIEPAHDDPG